MVDDGSADGTPEAVRAEQKQARFPLTLLESGGRGPAAARNRAMEVASAPVCLFLNDDSLARADLLARHLAFHRRRPEPEAALLGRIVVPEEPPPTPFMRWLADQHFDYRMEDNANASGSRFFTANVSAKTALLSDAGGFDEGFRSAAHEDIDMGLRLEALGMRLAYDPDAVVEHDHPLDLPGAIRRMRHIGVSLVPFVERHPDWPVPRRPALRHRAKAAALTGLVAARVRSPNVRRETWRFLCHEATREGYWDTLDGRASPGPPLRIGRTLARLAGRDADARTAVSAARPVSA